jgi:hypothetical protein
MNTDTPTVMDARQPLSVGRDASLCHLYLKHYRHLDRILEYIKFLNYFGGA